MDGFLAENEVLFSLKSCRSHISLRFAFRRTRPRGIFYEASDGTNVIDVTVVLNLIILVAFFPVGFLSLFFLSLFTAAAVI